MLWWKHPALVLAEIWGLSHKLHSTEHATEATRQEQSCALCKDVLRATTSAESLLKDSEPSATCHRWHQVFFIPELGGGTSVSWPYAQVLSLFTWRISPFGVGSVLKKEQRKSSEVVKSRICIASGVGMSGWTPGLTRRLPFFFSFLFLTSSREFLTSLFLQ